MRVIVITPFAWFGDGIRNFTTGDVADLPEGEALRMAAAGIVSIPPAAPVPAPVETAPVETADHPLPAAEKAVKRGTKKSKE